MESIHPQYSPQDLRPGDEPVDVAYYLANFQVKEVMTNERRRGDEFREALEKAKNAESQADLLQSYSPIDLPLSEIVEKSCNYAKELVTKYGPLERSNLDLICYVNILDVNETRTPFDTVVSGDFRSISIVSNRFRVVVWAETDAPNFLKGKVGVVCLK